MAPLARGVSPCSSIPGGASVPPRPGLVRLASTVSSGTMQSLLRDKQARIYPRPAGWPFAQLCSQVVDTAQGSPPLGSLS